MLQPHACTHFKFRVLCRTRSFSGRTSARSLPEESALSSKERAYTTLIICDFWSKNPAKLHDFQPAELVTSDVTASSPLRFWCKKRSKRPTPEKFVFSCQTSNVAPEPPNSLVFGRNRAPDVRRALDSVFCPKKQANSSPLSLSPLAFGPQKRPSSGVAGFSAARQPAEDLARSAAAR